MFPHHWLRRLDGIWAVRALAAALVATVACAHSGCNRSSTNPATTSAASNAQPSANSAEGSQLTLVMIPKATQATFWNSVRAGAERAAQEFDVNVTWKGPAKDNDRSEQKKVIQQFMNEGVDGILLAPTDSVALAPDVRTATAKGIPVLIFDSAVDGEQGKDFISFVATDNEAAGRLGGKHLMSLLGEGAKTVLFRHMEGHASTTAREAGALDEMKTAGATVLVGNRYSGETSVEAMKTALNMIDQIRQADGIFASNQTSAEGLLLALRQTNLAGKVKFVGFDSSPLLVEGLREGHIAALVVQDPVDMGYQSVKLMVERLEGKDIPPSTKTGVHLVTADNMADPEIAELIK